MFEPAAMLVFFILILALMANTAYTGVTTPVAMSLDVVPVVGDVGRAFGRGEQEN